MAVLGVGSAGLDIPAFPTCHHNLKNGRRRENPRLPPSAVFGHFGCYQGKRNRLVATETRHFTTYKASAFFLCLFLLA